MDETLDPKFVAAIQIRPEIMKAAHERYNLLEDGVTFTASFEMGPLSKVSHIHPRYRVRWVRPDLQAKNQRVRLRISELSPCRGYSPFFLRNSERKLLVSRAREILGEEKIAELTVPRTSP